MDFRLYDNTLGRFFGIDALSEQNHYLSTYNFGDGNPVVFSDPTGLDSQTDMFGRDRFDRWGMFIPWADRGPMTSSIDAGNSSGGSGGGNTTPKFKTAQELSDYVLRHSMPGKNTVWQRNWNGSFTATHYANFSFVSQMTFTSGAIGADGMAEQIGTHRYVITETSRSPIGRNGGGGIDFSRTNHFINIGGGVLGVLQGFSASNGYWLGDNGKYYNEGWGGNQHTGPRSGAFNAAKSYKIGGKGLTIIEAGIGIYATREGYKKDGGHFGYHAQHAAVSSAAGIGLGIAGAKAGAAMGAAIGVWFGGVGAVPGAVIGGVIGGFVMGVGGSYLGGYLGGLGVDYFHGQ